MFVLCFCGGAIQDDVGTVFLVQHVAGRHLHYLRSAGRNAVVKGPAETASPKSSS